MAGNGLVGAASSFLFYAAGYPGDDRHILITGKCHPSFCCSSFIWDSSLTTNRRARAAAIRSATGAEYMTPSMPKIRGRIMIRGRRKMICRVREMKIPLAALPLEPV